MRRFKYADQDGMGTGHSAEINLISSSRMGRRRPRELHGDAYQFCEISTVQSINNLGLYQTTTRVIYAESWVGFTGELKLIF